jgi:hypothetical protein
VFVPLLIAVTVSIVAFSLQRALAEEMEFIAAGTIGWLCLFICILLAPWQFQLILSIALLISIKAFSRSTYK